MNNILKENREAVLVVLLLILVFGAVAAYFNLRKAEEKENVAPAQRVTGVIPGASKVTQLRYMRDADGRVYPVDPRNNGPLKVDPQTGVEINIPLKVGEQLMQTQERTAPAAAVKK